MKRIPLSILEELAELHPDDRLILHRGPGHWKMEVWEAHPRLTSARGVPMTLWQPAFLALEETWQGSLTFFYDLERHRWFYMVRMCPPVDNTNLVEIAAAPCGEPSLRDRAA
jgi:hypothetical protein